MTRKSLNRLVGLSLCGLVLLSGDANAQGSQNPNQNTSQNTNQPPPPELMLGLRAEAVRRAAPVIPTVVVVPEGGSFLAAIASWRPDARFPVLIDNGSRRAAETIGRFVRGFRLRFPDAEVVRWEAPGGARPSAQAAADAAWGLGANAGYAERIDAGRQIGIEPPGVIVASAQQPERLAAAAIAAFRGQPVLWRDLPTNMNAAMPHAEAVALCADIETFVDDLGLDWRGLGDSIDSVLLCGRVPIKFRSAGDPKQLVALSDRVGRHADGSRWAWAGQIHGNPIDSTYRAMCALFIQPDSAWLFDGYESGDPWDGWDLTAAAEIFDQAGMQRTLLDLPANNAQAWRSAARSPIDAGLVLVNSMGNADFFQLAGDRLAPGDAPHMRHPVAIHMVHSWSTSIPMQTGSVMGRWLDRGAFAAIGSVQEPFLSAFVPSPHVAGRVLSSVPWGVAGRTRSEPWKIAVLGDPLYTLGPKPPTSERELPLENAERLDGLTKQSAEQRDTAAALRLLVLQGNDAQAARLGAAALADATDPQLAALTIPPAFRAGDRSLVLELAPMVLPTKDTDLLDSLWHAAYPELLSTPEQTLLRTLRSALRPRQEIDDATLLSAAWSRVFGKASAVEMLKSVPTPRPVDSRRIQNAIRSLR